MGVLRLSGLYLKYDDREGLSLLSDALSESAFPQGALFPVLPDMSRQSRPDVVAIPEIWSVRLY